MEETMTNETEIQKVGPNDFPIPAHWRDIISTLPHRYPFLLVDRVVEMVPGERILAFKNVTANEHFFQGHFPEFPVMPGVLQLEALAQTAALLCANSVDVGSGQKVPFLMSMDKVKFRRPVVPGDRLDLEASVMMLKSTVGKVQCVAKVDGQKCSEAIITAAMRDISDEV
jgi:3-hydroxyacyl-[acyl-carrier-protein] dehydratase